MFTNRQRVFVLIFRSFALPLQQLSACLFIVAYFQYQNGTTYASQGGYNTFNVGTDWVKCEFTFTPTPEDAYRMIVESYKANVPEAQQSGITIWSLSDNEAEHEYWLKGQVPNLFDKDYKGKWVAGLSMALVS